MQISGKAILVTGGASGLDPDRIAMGTGRSLYEDCPVPSARSLNWKIHG